jgi:hypothetical protein
MNMKHPANNSIEGNNMHGLIECTFVDYANMLRANYPAQIIRNPDVFASGIPEFARVGLIELIDARRGIPEGIPGFLVRTIKRAKHQPIWIPGENFPDNPWDIFQQMKPFIRNGELAWQHTLPAHRSTWRQRAMMQVPVSRSLN